MIDQSEIHEKAISPKIEDRREAARILKSGFSQFLDKILAWQDLRGLTQDEDSNVRMNTAFALESAFSHIPDKSEAWQDLLRLIQDENSFVGRAAGKAAGISFRYVPCRNNAWQDLHKLTLSEDRYVRDCAAFALGLAFPYIPDKEQGWQDLHRLINDEYIYVRVRATTALGIAFREIPDKSLAWQDLRRLALDGDRRLRMKAADSLGLAFGEIPDSYLALQDLSMLTQDNDWDVKKYSYHSLGRAHILIAIDSENTENWFKAFEDALYYFKESYKYGRGCLDNPSEFCLPFYCFCFSITSGDIKGDQIQKYLLDIKNAFVSCGREEFSIEVARLARTLQDYHLSNRKSSEDLTSELNTFLQYHDYVIEYVDPMEWCIVDAARLMLKYNPLSQKKIHIKSSSLQKDEGNLQRIEAKLDVIHENTKHLGLYLNNIEFAILNLKDSSGNTKKLILNIKNEIDKLQREIEAQGLSEKELTIALEDKDHTLIEKLTKMDEDMSSAVRNIANINDSKLDLEAILDKLDEKDGLKKRDILGIISDLSQLSQIALKIYLTGSIV